jgi:hypothetical protein
VLCFAVFRVILSVVKHSYRSPQSFSARQLVLLSLVVAAVVAALGFGLNVLLFRGGVPPWDLVLASSWILGGVAGWVLYQFLGNERNKQEMMQQRMHTIADLNHHIRNALQVIRYTGGSRSTLDASQLQVINEAVAGIDWALCEVLPKYSLGRMVGEASSNQADSGKPTFSSAVVEDFVLRHKETRPY